MRGTEAGRVNAAPLHSMPRSIDEALALRAAHPRAIVIGGATAAQLGWPAGRAGVPLIDLQALVRDARRQPARRGQAETGERALVLSAFSPLEALRRDPMVSAELPALAHLLTQVASAPVRRLGTLGGNLCWPAGDLGGAMLALGARLCFARAGEVAAAPAHELPTDDLLTEVVVPVGASFTVFEKIGYRAAFSPTLMTVAIVRDASGIRVAAGGGPTPAQRLTDIETLLTSGGGDEPALQQAVRAQLHTVSDALAAASERREVAARTIAGYLSAHLDGRSAR